MPARKMFTGCSYLILIRQICKNCLPILPTRMPPSRDQALQRLVKKPFTAPRRIGPSQQKHDHVPPVFSTRPAYQAGAPECGPRQAQGHVPERRSGHKSGQHGTFSCRFKHALLSGLPERPGLSANAHGARDKALPRAALHALFIGSTPIRPPTRLVAPRSRNIGRTIAPDAQQGPSRSRAQRSTALRREMRRPPHPYCPRVRLYQRPIYRPRPPRFQTDVSPGRSGPKARTAWPEKPSPAPAYVPRQKYPRHSPT